MLDLFEFVFEMFDLFERLQRVLSAVGSGAIELVRRFWV